MCMRSHAVRSTARFDGSSSTMSTVAGKLDMGISGGRGGRAALAVSIACTASPEKRRWVRIGWSLDPGPGGRRSLTLPGHERLEPLEVLVGHPHEEGAVVAALEEAELDHDVPAD